MGKITIVSKYEEPNHIFCGRGSPLGNPYVIGRHGNRDYVCDKYEEWFHAFVDELNFLNLYRSKDRVMSPQTEQALIIFKEALAGDVNLGCFCVTKKNPNTRCHVETIKNFIENKLEELEK